MKKLIATICLGAALLIGAQATAAPANGRPPDCKGHAVGWVAQIEPARPARPGDEPTLNRQDNTYRLVEWTPLCIGDTVVRPKPSSPQVQLYLYRRGTVVVADNEPIKDPGPLAKEFHDLGVLFEGLFGNSRYGVPVKGHSRGSLCMYRPVGSLGAEIKAVRQWDHVALVWSCAPDELGKWVVTITRADGRTIPGDTNRNRLDIIPSQLCPAGCQVVVKDRAGREVVKTRIVVVDASELPGLAMDKDVDRETADALIADRLLTTPADQGWRAQGGSLMLDRACRSALARQIVRQYYGPTSPWDPCKPEKDKKKG